MTSGKDDFIQSISVQLNGQNYSHWSYVMNFFLKRKRVWSYVYGSSIKSTDKKDEKYDKDLEIWHVNNLKILTQINNLVSLSIGIQLIKYDTAKDVWDLLNCLHATSNFTKQYQLEIEIQESYLAMSNSWDQLTLTKSDEF